MKSRMLIAAALALVCVGAADPAYHLDNTTTPFNAHRDVTAEDCYFDANHDAADLCAQWRAAKAAEQAAENSGWSNWIAGLSILLTGISILGLGFTVFYTRASLIEAKKATAAAQDSLAETRRTGQAQVRSYLGVTRVEGLINDDDCLCVKFVIRNFGSSPAYDVRVKIKAAYITLDAKNEISNNRVFEEFQVRDSGSIIPPQGEFDFIPMSTHQKLEGAELAGMPNGRFGARLSIYINGRDVFGLPTVDRPVFGTILRKKNEWTAMHLAAHFDSETAPDVVI